MSGPIVTTDGLRTGPKAAASLAASQWAEATGSADVLQAAYPTPLAALYDGLIVGVRALYANLTTTPVFSPDGFTAYVIKKGATIALAPGDIAGAGYEMFLRFNLLGSFWELLNPYVPFRGPTSDFAISTGSADALVATFSPAYGTLFDGLAIRVRANATNLTTAPTLAPDGHTARIIYKAGQQALAAGDIPITSDGIYVFHDDTTDWWELANPATGSSGSGSFAIASGTADTIEATFSPAHSGLSDGLTLTVRFGATNLTSAPTFNPDGLGTKIIYKKDKQPLNVADIRALQDGILVFHDESTDWWELTNPTGGAQTTSIATDDTGAADVNTAQAWFPTAQDAVKVANGSEYDFEGVLYMTRGAGANSHTTGILFAGTATFDRFFYHADSLDGDVLTTLALKRAVGLDATSTVVAKGASTSTSEKTWIYVKGRFKVAAAGVGTIIPQFIYSSAPGGAPTRKVGTYFKITPSPQEGTWA
jgi:hypothetical protein